MRIGEKITAARKQMKPHPWTQEKLAERLDVSVAAVSAWETGKREPDREHLLQLANVLGLSLDELTADHPGYGFAPGKPYFDPERTYTFVKTKALDAGLTQTLAALPFMRERYGNKVRKGTDVPHRIHPLTLAGHALAMNIVKDDVLATALLHDVFDETQTRPEDLPAEIGDAVKEAVCILSRSADLAAEGDSDRRNEAKEEYYRRIAVNPVALLVKCLDSCHSLSTVAVGSSREEIAECAREIEVYVLPMTKKLKVVKEWYQAAYLLRYQMITMLETIKWLL